MSRFLLTAQTFFLPLRFLHCSFPCQACRNNILYVTWKFSELCDPRLAKACGSKVSTTDVPCRENSKHPQPTTLTESISYCITKRCCF